MADVQLGNIVANLRIDTSQLAQAMQQAQQALGQLQQRVQSTASQATQATQATNQLTQSMGQLTQATQKATSAQSAWSQALAVAGGIGIATSIQGIVSAMANFAKSAVDVGVRMDSLRASLSAIANSSSQGAQQFQQLFETAQRLGVAFEPLARGWRTLTAAASQTSLSVADQQRLLNALATEARRVGASNEELQRSILAVSQMASKGKISMEELRQQLGEALPTAMAAAAQGMGRTTEEMIKLVETGNVRFAPFAQALTRGFEQMQQKSGDFASSAQQAFNRLGNAMVALKDAIGTNVLPELERIANVLRGILETTTSIIRAAGAAARGDTGVQGPNVVGLAGTPAQGQEEQRLQRLIDLYSKQAGLGTPEMQAQRQAMVARAQEQLEQLRASVRETVDQGIAQKQVTAEANRTADALARQKTFTEEVTKALEQLRKDTQAYREQAALFPERFGRPSGTADEIAEYNKGLQAVQGKGIEQLAAMIQGKDKDVQLTREQTAALAQLNTGYGGLQKAIDAARDAEQERKRVAREAEQQAKQAVSQEIQLTAQLAQLRATFQGADEGSAERARTQAMQRFVEAQRTIDQALRQLADNPALRARAPEMQQAFEALKAALPGQAEVAGLQAFNNAIERETIDPLRRLAESYTTVKATRDADTASTLEAAAANTIYAEEATKLANAIRDVARIEAQLPELRRQAEASAPAGEAALKAAQDQAAYSRSLQQSLERLQTPREEREALRLRQRAQREGLTISTEDEAILQRIEAQQRLNYAMGLFEQLANNIGNAWTNALSSIADGTRTVAEAFREMARSILQSMAQIASQEAFKALIRIGFGLIAGAAGGTAGGAIGGTSSLAGGSLALGGAGADIGTSIVAVPFQHGGIVRKPTLALLGENPATSPERILNNQQWNSLMNTPANQRGAPGANVTVINVASREEGERQAAQERALGKQVVLNYILEDLKSGSGSQVGRLMRISQQ